MNNFRYAVAALTTPLIAGCVAIPIPGDTVVSSKIYRSDGSEIGTVRMTTAANGVMAHIVAAGLPAGLHGAHVHAVGRCDGSDFASAGSHWDMSGRQHGKANPNGPHDGDLGNVSVGADGRLDVTVTIPGAALPIAGASGGEKVMGDSDGASLILHAAADDDRTDPSGNSGARIACSVLAAPAQR